MANLSISLLVSHVRCSCHFYTLAFFAVLSHSCIIFLTFFRVLIVASTLKSSQLKTTVLANLTVKTSVFFCSRGNGFPAGFVLDCAPVIPIFPHLHCSRALWYAMHYYHFTLKKVLGPTAFHFGVWMILLMLRFLFAVCDSHIQSRFLFLLFPLCHRSKQTVQVAVVEFVW